MKNRNFFITVLKTAGLLVGILLVKEFCLKETHGFSLSAIRSDRPFNPEWETHPLTSIEQEELAKAIKQPYYSFGSAGGQSFVFFSEDQQYVIKFFKQRFFNVPLWIRITPLPTIFKPYRDKKTFNRMQKLRRDFASYKMAFDHLQSETGLIYVHLNRTDNLNKTLAILDPLNIEHKINLDEYDFIIQKKAEPIYDRIGRTMFNGQRDEAMKAISSTLDLLIAYSSKGFFDRDPNIRTNCGLLGDSPVLIDIGKIMRDERMASPLQYQQTVREICEPFTDWLQSAYPELVPYLKNELDRKLHQPGNTICENDYY